MSKIVAERWSSLKTEDRSQKSTKKLGLIGLSSVDSMINIEPDYKDGVLTVSKGFTKKLYLGSRTPVRNMIISKDGNGDYKFTAICGGAVLDITDWRSGTMAYTEKATGLTDRYTHIVPTTKTGVESYLTLLYGTYPQKYDFNTVTQLTDNHKADFGLFVNDRLWTNDVDEPARSRWSCAGVPENFVLADNAGFLLIGSSSNPLTAMSSIFIPASQSTNIIIAKENEIHGITGSSGDSNDANRFRQYEYSQEKIGTTSPRGLQKAGSEMFILTKDDIVPFSTLNNQGYLRQQEITKPIRQIIRNRTNPNYLENTFMAFLNEGENGRLYAFMPFVNYEKNNQAFVYDFSGGGWFRRDFQNHGFTCITRDPETGQVFVGDTRGNIYEFNVGYNYDGAGYRKILNLGDCDFKLSSVPKTHTARSYIELEVPITGLEGLKVQKHDKIGTAVLIDYFDINIENYRTTFDNLQFDKSLFDDTRTIKEYLEFKGVFDKVNVIFSNFDADVNFKIHEIYLEADASRGI